MSAAREAGVAGDGDARVLTSPGVGIWRDGPRPGTWLRAGDPLGALEVLGRRIPVCVPGGVEGRAAGPAGPRSRAVEFGEALVALAPLSADGSHGSDALPGPAADRVGDDAGSVLRAPSSGRFYSRASPDKPVFVSVGDIIALQQTVGLLEVMKTFTRVHYGGPGLPDPAKVLRVVPEDGDEIVAGAPILEVEAAEP